MAKEMEQKAEALWDRFKDWLTANTPDLEEELKQPAMPWELEEKEEQLRTTLPDEFKAIYLIHNGGFAANGLIGNWDWLPLEEMLDEALKMDAEVEDGNFGRNQNEATPKVKGFWWNPSWIPFVSSGTGHYICLDMDPGSEGQKGQIILYLFDQKQRPVLAPDFMTWFETCITNLEDGKISAQHIDELEAWVFDKPGFYIENES